MLVRTVTTVQGFSLTDSKKAKIKNGKLDIKSPDLNWAKF
jgi:hypothetical protein